MSDCRDKIYRTTGGFIKGICHEKDKVNEALEAGFDWVRSDMPFPVNDDGSLTDQYYAYKERCSDLAKRGLRTIGITNYGVDYIRHGIDVRTPEGLQKAREICAYCAKDLKDSVQVWQITNEVNLTHMRVPLTSEEGKNFIIACTLGVKEGNPDAIVGHNSYGEEWLAECREIEEKTGGSDYIGLDLYDCTWTEGPITNYVEKIEKIYETMGLPIILMEFGFASAGSMMDMKNGDVDRWLQKRGIPNLQAAFDDVDRFVDVLTKPDLIEKGRNCDPGKKQEMVISLLQHEAETWLVKDEIPHTPEGEAQFYDYLLPELMKHPHLAGAVLYCMKDDKKCYYCDSPTCCCEIAWGLIDREGKRKPAFYAVQKHFAKH